MAPTVGLISMATGNATSKGSAFLMDEVGRWAEPGTAGVDQDRKCVGGGWEIPTGGWAAASSLLLHPDSKHTLRRTFFFFCTCLMSVIW